MPDVLAPTPGQGTDVFSPNHPHLCSVTHALSARSLIKIRQAILSNEFVHLHKLLSIKANEEPSQKLAYVNGEIVIKPYTKEAKISIIKTWTTAFLIYTDVFSG